MRRWSSEHLAALVQLACGVGFLGWGLIVLAPSGGAVPLTVVAVVTAGFLLWAWRTWRRAERARREPRAGGPAGSVAADGASATTPEPLSPGDEQELARVVGVLAEAGVFAPRAPDPAQLAEAAADRGPPVTADVVLGAVGEAGYHHPEFREAEHTAGLALHHSHVEQFPDTLLAQATDLVRLAAGGLDGVTVAVEQRGDDIRLRVAEGGAEQVLDYAAHVKYLSTVLHVALARILRERGTGRRLAWLWGDAGAWVTALPDGGVERLNAALGPAAGDGWEWVDEQEPHAAGDL